MSNKSTDPAAWISEPTGIRGEWVEVNVYVTDTSAGMRPIQGGIVRVGEMLVFCQACAQNYFTPDENRWTLGGAMTYRELLSIGREWWSTPGLDMMGDHSKGAEVFDWGVERIILLRKGFNLKEVMTREGRLREGHDLLWATFSQ